MGLGNLVGVLLLKVFSDFDAALDWPFDEDELLDHPAPPEPGPEADSLS